MEEAVTDSYIPQTAPLITASVAYNVNTGSWWVQMYVRRAVAWRTGES